MAKLVQFEGKQHSFPDDFTDDDISSALASMGPPKMPTATGSLGLGFVRGARDVIDNGAAMLTRGIQAVAPFTRGDPKARAAAEEQAAGWTADVGNINRAAERDFQSTPGAQDPSATVGRIAGNVVTTLPAAARLPFAAASSLVPRTASGALQGAVAAPLSGPAPEGEDFWAEKAKQATAGAVGGTVGAAAMHPIVRALSRPTPAVTAMMEAGVRPTPGQIMGGTAARLEAKAESIPLVGDLITNSKQRAIREFNTASVNRALSHIDDAVPATTDAGVDAIVYAGDAVSRRFNQVVPKMSLPGPDAAFAADLGQIGQRALYPQSRTMTNEILQRELRPMLTNGPMTGQELQSALMRLGEIQRSLRPSADATQRDTAKLVGEARQAFIDLLARRNPAVAEEFRGVQRASAELMRVENAASRPGVEPGIFTPPQLQAASKAMDTSSRKRASAREDAIAREWANQAREVLGTKYPDSGTAGRAMFGAGILAGPGAAAGAFNPLLAVPGALAAGMYAPGGRSLAAHLLATRNPTTDAVRQGIGLFGAPVGALTFGDGR